GERFYEAELYRLKGELLLAHSAENYGEAEACFQQALLVARHQQAKSSELRAAMSLSRLWQHQDKRLAAHQLLAPIYDWFTEGFDTPTYRKLKRYSKRCRAWHSLMGARTQAAAVAHTGRLFSNSSQERLALR